MEPQHPIDEEEAWEGDGAASDGGASDAADHSAGDEDGATDDGDNEEDEEDAASDEDEEDFGAASDDDEDDGGVVHDGDDEDGGDGDEDDGGVVDDGDDEDGGDGDEDDEGEEEDDGEIEQADQEREMKIDEDDEMSEKARDIYFALNEVRDILGNSILLKSIMKKNVNKITKLLKRLEGKIDRLNEGKEEAAEEDENPVTTKEEDSCDSLEQYPDSEEGEPILDMDTQKLARFNREVLAIVDHDLKKLHTLEIKHTKLVYEQRKEIRKFCHRVSQLEDVEARHV